MRYSSLMAWIESQYDRIEDRFYHSREVSKAILRDFSAECKNEGVKLIVAGILSDSQTRDMLRYCAKEGMAAVDISVDFRRSENVNWPVDGHPSAIANKQYADKLYTFLTKESAE